MRIDFCIDWLAFTNPLTLLASPDMYIISAPGAKGFISDTAHNGYKTAWRNPYGALCQWNEERPEMRVLSQYSGKTLTRYIEHGIHPHQIMQLYSIKTDTRLTRVDLAFDLRDSGIDIEALYRALKSANVKTASTKANMIANLSGGQTFYIGSRKSDKFLRIYDKANEQEVPGDWKRVELEVKGDTARALGSKIMLADEFTIAQIAKQMLWNTVQFPDPIWEHLCSERVPVGFSISHKKSDSIISWLADQVAPAIGKYILEGGDKNVIDTLYVLVNAWIDRKSRL